MIFEKDPDILFISEVNLMQEIPEEQRYIGGYKLVLPNSMESRGYARLILLIKEDINYKLLPQYMHMGFAAIWIQIGRQGRKPLKIAGIYREHTLLCQPGRGNVSNDPNLQLDRWNQMLTGWIAAAAGDANCIIIGDLNLDYLTWNNPDGRLLRMTDRTKAEVETLGFSQLIRGFTRSWPGVRDTCVDHIWTNTLGRIVSHSNVVRAGSDHNVISVIVRLKEKVILR